MMRMSARRARIADHSADDAMRVLAPSSTRTSKTVGEHRPRAHDRDALI